MTPYEIRETVSNVTYKNWEFHLDEGDGQIWLQVRFVVPDAGTGVYYSANGRKWLISSHMTRSEVVTTALKAVLTAEEHEAREGFKYQGRTIFNPHIDVDVLYSVSEMLDVREEKKHAHV